MQELAPSAASDGVLKKSIVAGKWLTIGTLVQRLIGTVSFFILARLLKPADFGIMAIILLVPRFMESTAETGLETALLQKKGDISHYLNPVWTIEVLKSFAIALLVFVCGPLIATYFHAEEALFWIRLGGIFIIIKNLSNIGGEMFYNRELDFRKIAVRNVARDASQALVSISLAFFWHSYIVLFFGNLAAYLAQVIVIYIYHPYRPRLSFNFGPLKELTHYSRWIIAQGWLTILYGFVESATVARLTTATDLGLYSKGKNLASVPPGLLTPMMNLVSFPAYAKVQNEIEKIGDGFQKTLDILFFFFIPMILLLWVGGKKIILILLGPVWLPMTTVFLILLVYFSLDSFNALSQSLFNAIGRTKRQAAFLIVRTGVTLAVIIPLTMRFGIVGTGIALLLGSLLPIILNLQSLISLTILRPRAIVKSVFWPGIFSVLLVFPVLFWKNTITNWPIPLFLLIIAVAGILYILATFFLGTKYNRGPYPTLKLIFEHII